MKYRAPRGFLHRASQKLVARALAPYRNYVIRNAGLTSSREFDEHDVFLVSYPKSGSTWLRVLMLGVIFGCDPVLMPFDLHDRLMPFVDNKEYYTRIATPMYFKSHRTPMPKYRRVIYLVRDGRDVVVSFLHHLRAVYGTEIDAMKFIQGGSQYYGIQWQDHIQAWERNAYDAEILTVKYEDLKTNPVGTMQRVCAFAGVTRDEALIQRVVEGAAFEQMQRKEKQEGRPYAEWIGSAPFVRRGKVGSYRDELPADQLAAFMERAGDMLRKYGYVE